MKSTSILLALFCNSILFVACEKAKDDGNNNTNSNTTPTKKQLLEAGKWQVSASSTTATYMGKDSTIDLYSQMDACEKDDFIEFANNGTGTVNENTNICPGNQQTANLTWALLNNDTKMSIIDNNPDTVDVAELTSTQMKLRLTTSNTSGTIFTSTITYKNIK